MPNQRSLLIPKHRLSIASSPVPSPLLTGLVSYWKNDESSAGVAPVTRMDSVVASANNLTDTNNTPSATGIISNGASFTSGLSQSLSCASNASLQTGDIDVTCTCWVKFSVSPNGSSVVFAKTTDSLAATTEWGIFGNAGARLRLQVSNGGALVGVLNTTVLTNGVWYFVVVSHDSINNIISISINNGAANTTSYSNGILVNTSPLVIGGSTASTFITSIVDEVGFWKRILTAPEITSLYNAGVGLTYPF